MLNEFNPGTIANRIERAFNGLAAPAETVVAHHKGGFVDLLLPGAAGAPVSHERAFQRRREIDDIYRELPHADVVVITLGLIEAWFDSQSDSFLNRVPPPHLIREEPDRYRLVILEVDDAYPLLESAFRLIVDRGKKIVLTVSPVPFYATFSGEDVIVANAFSKAVLRVCAQRLAANLTGVDYFPGYEIVTSGGLESFNKDNIHVRDRVVREITRLMLDSYEARPELSSAVKSADEEGDG